MVLQLAGLEQELAARLAAVRATARDVSEYLNHEDEALDLIVEDVLQVWSARKDDLTVEQVWEQYANHIEYAEPGSDNEYREGVIEGEDIEEYYYAVWKAHVAELRCPPS